MNQLGVDRLFSTALDMPARLWLAAGHWPAQASWEVWLRSLPVCLRSLAPGRPSHRNSAPVFEQASYGVEKYFGCLRPPDLRLRSVPFASGAGRREPGDRPGSRSGAREGRAGTGIHSIVLILHTDTVVNGEPPQGSDGNVHLELNGAGSSDPLYFSKAFAKGADVVACMVPAWDGTPGIEREILWRR